MISVAKEGKRKGSLWFLLLGVVCCAVVWVGSQVSFGITDQEYIDAFETYWDGEGQIPDVVPMLSEYATAAYFDEMYMVNSLADAWVTYIYLYQNITAGLAWGGSPVMYAMNNMYKATGDTKYLLENLKIVRATMANRDDKLDPPNAIWWDPNYAAPGWGTDKYTERWVIPLVHTGMIGYGVVDFLGLAAQEPSVMATFDANEYETMVAEIQETIDWEDRCWVDGPLSGEGSYIAKDEKESNEGEVQTFNRLSAMGRLLWTSWRSFGNTKHRDTAMKLATYIRNRINVYRYDEGGGDESYYWVQGLWNEYPLESTPAIETLGDGRLSAYASLGMSFPIMMGMDGVVFDSDDVDAMKNFVTYGMARLDNGVLMTSSTAAMRTGVWFDYIAWYEIWFLLADYSQEVYDRMAEFMLKYQKQPQAHYLAGLIEYANYGSGSLLAEDIDCDRDVDLDDLAILAGNFDKCSDPCDGGCETAWDVQCSCEIRRPEPWIQDPNAGLWHEFNDVNCTYGYNYITTCTSIWSFSDGIGTNISTTNTTNTWGTALADGTAAYMATDEDWVAQFRVSYAGTDISYKLWELNSGSQGTEMLQIHFWTDGTLRLVDYDGTWDSPAGTVPINEWFTLAVHYRSDVQLMDLWIDDQLIRRNMPSMNGYYDLSSTRMRGPVSYDEVIFGRLYDGGQDSGSDCTDYLAGDIDQDLDVDEDDFDAWLAAWPGDVPTDANQSCYEAYMTAGTFDENWRECFTEYDGISDGYAIRWEVEIESDPCEVPVPTIYAPEPGLYHTFDTAEATYGRDLITTCTSIWSFSDGIGTNISNTSTNNKWGVGTASGLPGTLDNTRDWVALFNIKRDSATAISKLFELTDQFNEAILQVDFLADGTLTLVDGDGSWSSGSGVLPEPNTWFDLTFHCKADTNRLDVWLDDELLRSDMPPQSADAQGLYASRMRGPISYDTVHWGRKQTLPRPVINRPGAGLWHEFNDVNCTYGYNYTTTCTSIWSFADGIGTNTSNTNGTNDWGTADEDGTITAMDPNKDWVAAFHINYDGSVIVSKLYELVSSSEGIEMLQIHFYTDGTLMLVDDDGTWSSGSGVIPIDEWFVLTVHYRSGDGEMDLWVDDELVRSGMPSLCGAYDLVRTRMRGPVSYDTVLWGELDEGLNDGEAVRVTEYALSSGDFTGTTYDLTLDYDLADDYFVLVRGSRVDNDASDPDNNYARVYEVPDGTGELGASGADNVISLSRHVADYDWEGVVTVVECLNGPGSAGFELLDIVETSLSGTSGSDTSGTSWTDANDIVLFGGYRGGGAEFEADATSADQGVSVYTRLYPSSTNTLNWTRNAGGETLKDATMTTFVVEWGSEWTVQHAYITGSNGGDGADSTSEYTTETISAAPRANTWVWGTGCRADSGVGECAEACLVTLGDGVTQLETSAETELAVGSETTSTYYFDVYALTHPKLMVDYRFKMDGNSDDNDVSVTIDRGASGNSFAWVYNSCNGIGTNHPVSTCWSQYDANRRIATISRGYKGEDFAAWLQGIDFSDVKVVRR